MPELDGVDPRALEDARVGSGVVPARRGLCFAASSASCGDEGVGESRRRFFGGDCRWKKESKSPFEAADGRPDGLEVGRLGPLEVSPIVCESETAGGGEVGGVEGCEAGPGLEERTEAECRLPGEDEVPLTALARSRGPARPYVRCALRGGVSADSSLSAISGCILLRAQRGRSAVGLYSIGGEQTYPSFMRAGELVSGLRDPYVRFTAGRGLQRQEPVKGSVSCSPLYGAAEGTADLVDIFEK